MNSIQEVDDSDGSVYYYDSTNGLIFFKGKRVCSICGLQILEGQKIVRNCTITNRHSFNSEYNYVIPIILISARKRCMALRNHSYADAVTGSVPRWCVGIVLIVRDHSDTSCVPPP